MFQSSGFELTRIQHGHGNNEWHDMNEVEPAHDSAASDPERGWASGRIFRCSTCADEIRVNAPEDDAVGRRA